MIPNERDKKELEIDPTRVVICVYFKMEWKQERQIRSRKKRGKGESKR